MPTNSPLAPEADAPSVRDPLIVAIVSALRALVQDDETDSGRAETSGVKDEADAA